METRQEEGTTKVGLVASDGAAAHLARAFTASLPALLERGLLRCRCPFCGALSGEWEEDETIGAPVWASRRFRSWLGRVGIDAAGLVRDLVLTGGVELQCGCGRTWRGGVS